MGVSGLSALRLTKALEADVIAINDGEVASWAHSSGVLKYLSLEFCFCENDAALPVILDSVDLVILSPGISREHKLLRPLLDRNVPIWGEIELAYRYLDAQNALSPIIGITGTNGKTTSTAFLGKMIEGDNKSVFVGGNIGVPFCDYAFNLLSNKTKLDFILLELSSFQLESIDQFHVNIAIILNLFQNHGERYTQIEDYALAKFNIVNKFTNNDILIYPEDFPLIKVWASEQIGIKIAINTKEPHIGFDTKEFKLPGAHNLVNLAFIVEAAQSIGLSNSSIEKCIKNFKGVHHRIEYVDGVKGLPKFMAYNDSKSTNWDATLTAVTAMKDFKLPIHLIIGGKKRGHGDSILPYLVLLKKHVSMFYLIGEMASEIEEEIKGSVKYKNTGSLEITIKILREQFSETSGVLLFSPGFPSFDQFQNYAKRGEHFIKLLKN